MPSVAARRVLRPDGSLRPGTVRFDERGILGVDDGGGELPDRTVAPAFVDLQINGYGDDDIATAEGAAWDRLDTALAAHGVGTWCPTLTSAPLEDYGGPLGRIAAAAARPGDGRPAIAGVHLEGPFLARAGAHRDERLRAPSAEWLATLPAIVRVVTLAPELEGALDAIAALAGRGVLVALGHSNATLAEAEAAVDAGARLVTHLFNAMVAFHHREPGIAGAGLDDPRLSVSLIPDGIHVHPVAIRLAFRAKGAARVALVTDAVAWRSPGLDVSGGAARLAGGTLAGSVLTMDEAVRRTVGAGVDLADALIAAAATPARLLGLDDRGALVEGRRADIVALGPDLEVEALWLGGRPAVGG